MTEQSLTTCKPVTWGCKGPHDIDLNDSPALVTSTHHIDDVAEFVIASDGPTGITLASKSPIDVVVLAFEMRGMDGDQVAEVLLKHQPDLPIVVCTSFFDAVPEGLRWFADACVEKRDGPDVLLSAIQEVIAHKKVPGQAVAA